MQLKINLFGTAMVALISLILASGCPLAPTVIHVMETPLIEDYVKRKMEQGIENTQAGRYDEAIKDFNDALKIKPAGWVTVNSYQGPALDYRKVSYYYRGVVYNAKGQYEMAIADFNKALEIGPKLAEAYYW
jgi:tetratricopeptide (TPR) repeat protein